jgi:hypothetical protein
MERRTNSPYPRLDRPVLAIIGLLLVLSTVLFTKGDREHEWRYYQWDFKRVRREARRGEGEDGPKRAAADLGALARARGPLHDLPPGGAVGGI